MNKRLVHGGNVYAAARELRRPIGSVLDFSASINPLGPSPKAVRALLDAVPLIQHYPDPDCVSLKRVLGRRWNVSTNQLVVANGSTELIDVVPRALSIRSALIVGPTYGEYARSVERAAGRYRLVLAKKEDSYRPPFEEVIRRLAQRSARAGIDAVFIAHPNSPTGQACQPDELNALFQAANRRGIWIILDESFIDYCEAMSCLHQVRVHARLIVLRSFTKFYGLPGLRIGYSISSPPVAAMLEQYRPPWSVNAMAQRAAEAALSDRAHARRCLVYVKNERDRMVTQLSLLPGLTVYASSANFLLLELPRLWHARTVAAGLRRKGILIRECASVEGCSPYMIRIAIRARVENDRLLAAFRHLLRG